MDTEGPGPSSNINLRTNRISQNPDQNQERNPNREKPKQEMKGKKTKEIKSHHTASCTDEEKNVDEPMKSMETENYGYGQDRQEGHHQRL